MKPYDKTAWKEGYTEQSWQDHQIFKRWAIGITIIALLVFITCII